MADVVHNRLPYNLALGFVWTTATIRGLLVAKTTWTPDADDDFVQTALTAGAVEMSGGGYARQTLASKTTTLDDTNNRVLLDGGQLNFGSVTGTDAYDTLVVYRFVTNDTDSWLIASFDLGAQAANSAPITFDPHTDGYVELTT